MFRPIDKQTSMDELHFWMPDNSRKRLKRAWPEIFRTQIMRIIPEDAFASLYHAFQGKHRLGGNSIKMYDKQGSILRVETTINDPTDFKSFRSPEGKPEAEKKWLPMRKGIADLHRRTEVSQAANTRYLHAMASVEDTTSVGELAADLCLPAIWKNRRVRAMNPYSTDDANLLDAISRGEFMENGFRNRDIRSLLSPGELTKEESRLRSPTLWHAHQHQSRPCDHSFHHLL